jgi:hypothetical protein
LNEIVRESGWARTIAIGDLLVERVFHGFKDALSAPRDACEHPSIRKLAQRPDCPLRKTALAQAIGVYSVVEKEPGLRQLAGITPAHVALVVSFPSDQRREMLARVEAEKWSVRMLARATKEMTSTHAVKTTRRASSRQALAFYQASLKAAEAGLRLLWRHEEMERTVSVEMLAAIRSLAAVINDSGDLVSRMRKGEGQFGVAPSLGAKGDVAGFVNAKVLAKASTSRSTAPRLPRAAGAEG